MHRMTPKWSCHIQGQKYAYAYHIHPQPKGPNFHPFHSTISRFQLHSFSRKMDQMAPNDLDMFKVKITHMHTTCIPDAQIFLSVSLYNEQVSIYAPLSEIKWPQMTRKVKNTKMHAAENPDAQMFVFRSTMCRFWIPSQFCEKCTELAQNHLDMFKVNRLPDDIGLSVISSSCLYAGYY